MESLSASFLELQAVVDVGDARGIDAISTRMLGFLDGDRTADDAVRRSHFERLGRTLHEMRELAGEGRVEGAAQALEEVRATCVSCHVLLRQDNETRGLFPAVGNTVSGQVTLQDLDGAPRADRSSVLLFLERTSEVPHAHLRKNPVIDQRDRAFHPEILPVVCGTTVEFPNGDTIFHNIFSLSRVKPFDLGVYEPGDSRHVTMDQPGLVKIYCNIHPEMKASVVVLANPYFVLADADGRFVLAGVPDGEWTLRAWNELGADLRLPVELADGDWQRFELDLRETKRLLPHKNKFGKDYDKRYR